MAGGKEGDLAVVTTALSGRRSKRCMEFQSDERKKTRIPRSRGVPGPGKNRSGAQARVVLGKRSFSEKLLAALSGIAVPKRKRGSVAGEAASARDESEAERIAMAALPARDAPSAAAQLHGKGK
jgi:hypothetical protein